MNTRVKGRNAEKEYVAHMKDMGFMVLEAPGSTKWNKQVDLFGMWDTIAFGNGRIVFTQIKCNRTAGAIKKGKKWIEDNKQYLSDYMEFEVAVRMDGKRTFEERWKIHNL